LEDGCKIRVFRKEKIGEERIEELIGFLVCFCETKLFCFKKVPFVLKKFKNHPSSEI